MEELCKLYFNIKEKANVNQSHPMSCSSNSPRRKELLKFLKPHITSVEVDERGIEEYFMNQFDSDDFLTRAD